MRRVFRYVGEVKSELAKIIWPKRADVIRLTAIVFTISGVIAAYVGGLDFLFTSLLNTLIAR